VVCEEIEANASKNTEHGEWLLAELDGIKKLADQLLTMAQDEMEMTGKKLFEQLTSLYQMALMINACDETSEAWVKPSLDYFRNQKNNSLAPETPLSAAVVKNLIAWAI